MYFDAQGYSTRQKHVAHIDETIKILLWFKVEGVLNLI